MKIQSGGLYHIYNRGNNRQRIFYSAYNYVYFTQKISEYISSCSDLLAYCLMPNHFHFLIHANDTSVKELEKRVIQLNKFSESLRIMLSSYSRSINKQEHRTGSLFRQNTRTKALMDWSKNYNYSEVCFNYIHLNPIASGLVSSLFDWPYSSFFEYTGKKSKGICNTVLAREILDINWTGFQGLSQKDILSKEELSVIF